MLMAADSGLVFAPQPSNGSGIENSAVAKAVPEQDVIDSGRERSLQPLADRRIESMLRSFHNRFRKLTFEQTPQEVLALVLSQLERCGDGCREFEQFVIEQRIPGF